MRRNPLILTLFAISLALISTAAFSQPQGRNHDKHYEKRHERSKSDYRPHSSSPRYRPTLRHEYEVHPTPQSVRPVKRFYRGSRLPHVYHRHHYVVHHWHDHHLHRPPRGHHWVMVGSEYLLVAVATGVIVDIRVTH